MKDKNINRVALTNEKRLSDNFDYIKGL